MIPLYYDGSTCTLLYYLTIKFNTHITSQLSRQSKLNKLYIFQMTALSMQNLCTHIVTVTTPTYSYNYSDILHLIILYHMFI